MWFPKFVLASLLLQDMNISSSSSVAAFTSTSTAGNYNAGRLNKGIQYHTTHAHANDQKRQTFMSLSSSTTTGTTLMKATTEAKIPDILDFFEDEDLPENVNVNQITETILALASETDVKAMNKEKLLADAETVVKVWAQTKSSMGAQTIEQIVERLEQGGDDYDLVTSNMYSTVSYLLYFR